MNESARTKPLSLFHQFLFSIVIIAPFYNLIKKSDYKIEIISGLLIILTFFFHRIAIKAHKKFHSDPRVRERLINRFNKIDGAETFRTKNQKSDPVESRLKKLKKLKNSGLISEKEYSDKKREIIEKL